MSKILWIVYRQPLHGIAIIILLLIIIWSAVGIFAGKKQWWRLVNAVVGIGITVMIFYATVYSRESDCSRIILIPFYSFIAAQNQPELYRTMVMNLFLFVPLGLSMPFALKSKHNALVTILIAVGLSVFVEIVQYFFGLGWSEIDDVIMNTLGAAIGTLPFVITKIIRKRHKLR